MHDGRSLNFFTTNEGKIRSARRCLEPLGIAVHGRSDALHEIQADNIELIARHKAAQAYARAGRPVIVEDSGLFIDALNGFPGPYVKAVMATIGPPGLLRLLDGYQRRSCTLTSALVLQWSATDTVAFTSAVSWRIRTATGEAIPEGWSDLWTLLEPAPTRDDVRSVAGTSGAHHPEVFVQLAEWLSQTDVTTSTPAAAYADRSGL